MPFDVSFWLHVYQLAQFVLKIGSALAEWVGQGELDEYASISRLTLINHNLTRRLEFDQHMHRHTQSTIPAYQDWQKILDCTTANHLSGRDPKICLRNLILRAIFFLVFYIPLCCLLEIMYKHIFSSFLCAPLLCFGDYVQTFIAVITLVQSRNI